MAEFGYPFDSQVTFESDGTPVFDRALLSADLRGLFHKLLTDGVILNPSNNLQVTAGEGMNVIVQAGFGIVQGAMRKFEVPKTLAVQASDTTYDRIDTVVLRFNDDINYRNIDLYVLKGVASQKPVRPNLTRTDSVYELGLADLFISKNTTMIAEYKITDTRLETERCGEVSAIYEFDTTTLYNQIQSDLDNFQTEEKAEFDAWFETIKDTLSGDVAGKLQNEIGTLSQLTTSAKDNLVNAVNEVNAKEVEVIDTKQEIKENIQPNKAVGALGLKEILGGENMISFGVDSDGNYGYIKAGADSVIPFKSYKKIASELDGRLKQTLDIKKFSAKYKNLTKDNFILSLVSLNGVIDNQAIPRNPLKVDISYDSSNGILTIEKNHIGLWQLAFTDKYFSAYSIYDVYII